MRITIDMLRLVHKSKRSNGVLTLTSKEGIMRFKEVQGRIVCSMDGEECGMTPNAEFYLLTNKF